MVFFEVLFLLNFVFLMTILFFFSIKVFLFVIGAKKLVKYVHNMVSTQTLKLYLTQIPPPNGLSFKTLAYLFSLFLRGETFLWKIYLWGIVICARAKEILLPTFCMLWYFPFLLPHAHRFGNLIWNGPTRICSAWLHL